MRQVGHDFVYRSRRLRDLLCAALVDTMQRSDRAHLRITSSDERWRQWVANATCDLRSVQGMTCCG
jgi:hypothetical protein